MTTCASAAPAPLQCPTLQQSIEATAALLPRGRAWPARDRSAVARFLAWLGGLTGTPKPSDYPPGFVQTGFIAAIGAVRNFIETQLCALRLEFWCATQTLTTDLWMAEYGLPDDCDPFPDLCAKVAALGGRRCELYQQIAAANGWVIACNPVAYCVGNGAFAGSGLAGNIMVGGPPVGGHIVITVFLVESPAYGIKQSPFLAGCALAGMTLSCPPEIGPLQCLIERIVPAHVAVSYQTVN